VQLLHLLASEGGAKNLWDPTILGVLTVLSGVVLFCGSAYMLLSTNLGARQGFLVAFSALTGIIMLLGLLWFTTSTPLNVPKGRVAEWKPVSENPTEAIVADPADATIAAVRTIVADGAAVPVKAPEDSDLTERAELRPAVEAALVKEKAEGPEPVEAGPLVLFSDDGAGDLLTDLDELESYVVGGGTKNLIWHEPRYAAVQFCTKFELDDVFADPNAEIADSECDPALPKQWLILERDFGSLRLPAVFYTLMSGLLFGLSLYAMHIKERSEQHAEAGALTPANA
jgi:hypothetical protein